MTVTPQTNATLEQIAEELIAHNTVAICGHVNPDGDCIGSALGLAAALRAVGKNVTVLKAEDDSIDEGLSFLRGYDGIVAASEYDKTPDLFVSVDVPNNKRIGDYAAAIKKRSSCTITIDHHEYDERVSDLSYTDPDSASTTLIIWKVAKLLGIDEDDPAWADIATSCYSGLLTDTGRFLHSNTNHEALKLASEMAEAGARMHEACVNLFQKRSIASVKADALTIEHMREISVPESKERALLSWLSKDDIEALGATNKDIDNAVNVMRSIDGYAICCMLKETSRGIRGSFRSKGDINVAEIAQQFEGGGHKAAAGFNVDCSNIDEAIDLVENTIKASLANLTYI